MDKPDLHLKPTSQPSPSLPPLPPLPPLRPHHQKRHQPPPTSSWADIVDESRSNNNGNNNTTCSRRKRQKLDQIMNWHHKQQQQLLQQQQYKSKHNKQNSKQNTPKFTPKYKHKDGDKIVNSLEVASVEDGGKVVEGLEEVLVPAGSTNITTPDIDTLSCDTQSSCDTHSQVDSILGEEEDEGTKKRKRNKKKKKKDRSSASEEGKKVFVGGIKFESDPFLSNDNETLASLRQYKFSQIFYLFGKVTRVQGHWNSGYCFVVFAKRRSAKLAVKCLAMAPVRRKVIKNLRDDMAPSGVMPLPTFYARWPSSPQSASSHPSATPSSALPAQLGCKGRHEEEDEEDVQMAWLDGKKEEEINEEDVERLMRELLKLNEEEDATM